MNKVKVVFLSFSQFLMVCLCVGGGASVYAQDRSCDEACLINMADQYMSAAVKQDWSDLPWADQVRYTENNVAMMIGDGFWGAVGAGNGVMTEVDKNAFSVADQSTGNVVWFGITHEHGQAAYHGLRLKVVDQEITEVESFLGREGTPDLFNSIDGYQLDKTFAKALTSGQSRPKARMTAIVDGYFNTKQLNDGVLFTEFSDNCSRLTNGVNVTYGDHWAAQAAEGCEKQMELGLYKPVDRIRARHYPIVNEQSGIVVALSIEDHATRYIDYQSLDGQELTVEVEYPNSRGMLEIFKIIDGKISKIEGISVFLPYYIHSLWD